MAESDTTMELASPPSSNAEADKCVICLSSKINDPTILDSCTHFYCFACISEWVSTHPTCPMCKVAFTRLKHELRPRPKTFPIAFKDVAGVEIDVFDIIERRELAELQRLPPKMLTSETSCLTRAINDLKKLDRHIGDIEQQDASFASNVLKMKETLNTRLQDFYVLRRRMANFTHRSEIYGSPVFRKLIYKYNMAPSHRISPHYAVKVLPNLDPRDESRARERLIPYLVRDVCAIVDRPAIDIDKFLDNVVSYLLNPEPENMQRIRAFLVAEGIPHPLHFLLNARHFVASGERVAVYDQNCEFYVRGTYGHQPFELNDSEVEIVSETIDLTGSSAEDADPLRYDRSRDSFFLDQLFRNYGINRNGPADRFEALSSPFSVLGRYPSMYSYNLDSPPSGSHRASPSPRSSRVTSPPVQLTTHSRNRVERIERQHNRDYDPMSSALSDTDWGRPRAMDDPGPGPSFYRMAVPVVDVDDDDEDDRRPTNRRQSITLSDSDEDVIIVTEPDPTPPPSVPPPPAPSSSRKRPRIEEI